MPADFQPLVTEVTELTTVADSAVALMDGFSQRLADAIAADNLSDNTNVAQFAAEFEAQKQKLADAVTRNTPVA
jgi:carbamate kinase